MTAPMSGMVRVVDNAAPEGWRWVDPQKWNGAACPLAPAPNTASVLDEVGAERGRQHEKFGEQNPPDIDPNYVMMSGDLARDWCDEAFAAGKGTWQHILLEEVAEAIDAAKTCTDHLRTELVQVAAVAVAWIEAIDRRPKETEELAPTGLFIENLCPGDTVNGLTVHHLYRSTVRILALDAESHVIVGGPEGTRIAGVIVGGGL